MSRALQSHTASPMRVQAPWRSLRGFALSAMTWLGVILFSVASAPPATAQGVQDLLKPEPYASLEPTIGQLGPGDERKSATQREMVSTLARSELGMSLGVRTETDLDGLQRLVDGRHVAASDTYLQQALGVVLGDALVRNFRELTWVVVDDRYGHSRALRYRETEQLFFPVTMISKRMAVGMGVDVRELYGKVAGSVATFEAERTAQRKRERGRR